MDIEKRKKSEVDTISSKLLEVCRGQNEAATEPRVRHQACLVRFVLSHLCHASGGFPTLEAMLQVADTRADILRRADADWRKRREDRFAGMREQTSRAFWIPDRLARLLPEDRERVLDALQNWHEYASKPVNHPNERIRNVLQDRKMQEWARCESTQEKKQTTATVLEKEFHDAVGNAEKALMKALWDGCKSEAESIGLHAVEIAVILDEPNAERAVTALRELYAEAWKTLFQIGVIPIECEMREVGKMARFSGKITELFVYDYVDPSPLNDDIALADAENRIAAAREMRLEYSVPFAWGFLESLRHSRFSTPHATTETTLRALEAVGVNLSADAVAVWDGRVPSKPLESNARFYQYSPRADGLVPIITIGNKPEGYGILLATPELIANPDGMARHWGIQDDETGTDVLKPVSGSDAYPNPIRLIMDEPAHEIHMMMRDLAKKDLAALIDLLINSRRVDYVPPTYKPCIRG